ncbi:MAG: hypothetical protein EOP53_03630 [Sphingobacteriales bacterium]|nr:MAG: hypothetical protein EOP53_03630 [Sphingobacteriales bacterium]
MKYILNKYRFCLAFLFFAFAGNMFAQNKNQQNKNNDENLIQLSGLIKADPKTPIPFSTVRIKNTIRGTIAAVDGFYSLVVREKDTVEYVAIGYKTARFVVPGKVQDHKFTYNVMMLTDTFTFEEVNIYPWPTKEDFKEAFLSLQVEDTYADIAKKNLDQQKLMELYESLAKDGKENQMYALQQMASSYYYAGGQKNYMMMGGAAVPTSLLNPIAWTQFIRDLQAGKFKKKK